MKAVAELEDIVAALAKHEVDYLLCGGFAVSLYGVPRITMDIDILLRFTEENVQKFIAAARAMKYVNALPVSLEILIDEAVRKQFITERNLIAYSFYSTLTGKMNLDVMIDTPLPFEDLWERREIRKTVAGSPVQVIGKADLIQMKAYAGRDKDKADIILLSKIQNISRK